MVNKFTHEVIDQSLDELKECIEGTDFEHKFFVMNFAHLTTCPTLQQFLIHASQIHCPHFLHGIILGLMLCKNQELHNTTEELQKLFKLEG